MRLIVVLAWVLDWIQEDKGIAHDAEVVHDGHVLVIELLHHALYPLLSNYVYLIQLILFVDSLAEDSEQRLTLSPFLVDEFDLVG